MKYFLLIALNLLMSGAFAQVSVKKQILERVHTLLPLAKEGQEALKSKDYQLVCKNINELFRIMPDHLLSLGISLNQFDPKAMRMIQETQNSLIEVHRKKNLCDRSAADTTWFLKGEPLKGIPSAEKILKDLEKRLAFQKKKLPKMDTDYNNYFNYDYEFN
jgi:hypothetical protein